MAHELSEQLRHEKEIMQEEHNKAKKEHEKMNQENEELRKLNAKLIGHQNPKQKIQHHMKIKQENDNLKREKAALERENRKYKLALKRNNVIYDKENDNQEDIMDQYSALSKNYRYMHHSCSPPSSRLSCTREFKFSVQAFTLTYRKLQETGNTTHIHPRVSLEVCRTQP